MVGSRPSVPLGAQPLFIRSSMVSECSNNHSCRLRPRIILVILDRKRDLYGRRHGPGLTASPYAATSPATRPMGFLAANLKAFWRRSENRRHFPALGGTVRPRLGGPEQA